MMVRRNEYSGASRPSWAGSPHAVADLQDRVGQRARYPVECCGTVRAAGQADGVEVAARQLQAATVGAAAAQDDAGPAGGALEYVGAQSGAPPPPRDAGSFLPPAGAGRAGSGADRVDAG
jgi:hypothetical protein